MHLPEAGEMNVQEREQARPRPPIAVVAGNASEQIGPENAEM
jgi:hypothetical protein